MRSMLPLKGRRGTQVNRDQLSSATEAPACAQGFQPLSVTLATADRNPLMVLVGNCNASAASKDLLKYAKELTEAFVMRGEGQLSETTTYLSFQAI